MSRFLRVFFVGGVISYRALFNWIRPSVYIPTMLGGPLFQLLFFTYLGRYATRQPDSFFVVGNAIQVSAFSAVFGMSMAVANERWFGRSVRSSPRPPTARRSSSAAASRCSRTARSSPASRSSSASCSLLLFCGVNVPLDVLPGWMSAISRCLPLTHAIMAGRKIAAGASLGDVGGLVWTELGIAAAYAAAAYVVFRILERESRRSAVLDGL